MNVRLERIEEHVIEGKRLGRHIEHDPRSKNYPFEAATVELHTTYHGHYGGILDQGQLGSCTGNATAGAVNTRPLDQPKIDMRNPLVEADALALYERATVLDGFPGEYPPDDTGSSGIAAAKAAVEKGYCGSYRHTFSIDAALQALMHGPLSLGIAWYEGFDDPDASGLIKIAGQIRGGHQIVSDGFYLETDLAQSIVECRNSWGLGYGVRGRMHMTVSTLQQLLEDSGDSTILVRA